MGKKIFLLAFFLLAPLFLIHPASLQAQVATPTPKPFIKIYYGGSDNNTILEFSSTEEPKIGVASTYTSGSAKLEIYQATLDDLLQYLIHDDKYQQLYKTIDVSKLSHLQDLNINLTEAVQDISLPLPPSGIFFLRLKMGALEAQTYVIRSLFGTVGNEAKDTMVLWSQDFTTKRSLDGGKATLYSLENQKKAISTANLDSTGVASLLLSKNADAAVVESQGSISLVPLNVRFLNGGYWGSFQENKIQKRFFIFTDRPIYKPGDTVRFKAIIRDDDDARYSVPNGSVNVEVSQGYDKKIYLLKDTLTVDSNGFVGSTFVIPKTAKTGEYQINLNPGVAADYESGDSSTGDYIFFKVENYRKPEYFINAESSQIDVVRGDSVDVKINGEYYSGQPLAGAKVNYKVTSNNSGYYESEYYYPSNGDNYYRSWYGTEVDSGVVTLDAKGKANITLPTSKNDSQGKYQIYFIEFIYQDDTGNPSTTGANVLVRSGDFSLYRDGYGPYGGKPNQEISLPMILKANRVGLSLSQKVNVSITRHWWEEVKNPNAKYSNYINKEENVGRYSFFTDSSGKAIFNFTPKNSGSYELNTESTDSRGNKITKIFYLWVNDQYYYGDTFNEESSLKIITDKKTYRSGDIALVSLVSDIPDRDVFLSFQRDYQDRYQVVHLAGKEKTIETKIYDHDVPNIFLAAKTFDNDGLAGAIQDIAIDTSGKKAFFTLTTDKQNYAPGDDVTVNITAKDVSGNPLETNFALWSVDKAIFALADKNYGDIFDRFWSKRYNGTSSAHSLEGIIEFSNGAEKGGCFLSGTKIKMADGSEKSIEDIKVGDQILTRLSDTSSKLVKTNVSAIHAASTSDYFIINQTLRVTGNHLLFINRNWRQAGFVQIGDELIDSNGNQIKVFSIERLQAKNSVYNFTSDTYHTYFADGLYVHNDKGASPRDNFADTAYWNLSVNTDSSGKAQIKFKLPDNLTTWVITALGASRDTRVGEAFTEIKVNKDLVIRPALPNVFGDGDLITITALVNNFTDLPSKSVVTLKTDAGVVNSPLSQTVEIAPNDFFSVSWQIKVGQPGPAKLEFSVKDNLNRFDDVIQNINIRSSGYWQQSSEFKIGTNNFTLSKPDKMFDSQKSEIKLSLSSSVLGSLPSAMTYLINYPYGCTEQTTSGLLPKIIARKYPIIFAEALKQQSKYVTIDQGIEKLTSLQNSDGGWPWWWGDSNGFVTAYVYHLLIEARGIGVKVDDSLFTNAEKYFLNNYDNDSLETKVVKAYGLSFSPDVKIRKTILDGLEGLGNDYLALAVVANISGGQTDPAKNGLNLLLSRAQTSAAGIYWPAGKSENFGSVESSTALAVQALVKSETNLPEAAKAISYLMKNRRFDYWASTYATAQTILAVTDYSRLQKETETDLSYTVSVSGQAPKTGKLVGFQATPVEISIAPDKVIKGGFVNIAASGQGEIYSTLTQKWWLKDPSGAKASHGVTITKKIVNHKGEQYNLVPGDLADVVLNVVFDPTTPGTNSYAIIEDHLPAGLIPVNTRLKNESETGNPYDYYDYSREYLLDGIIIPVYYGSYASTYTYQARVISAGTFNVPPSYYGLMYYPEYWARSESSTLVVDTETKVNPAIMIRKTIIENSGITKRQIYTIIFFGIVGVSVFLGSIYAKKKKLS